MKAAAYARVSTVAQGNEERWGFHRQAEEIERYAESSGLELVATFKDAVSGSSVTRTGLTQLKDESGRFGAVIISSVDRLARTVSASHKVLAELLDLGLEVHSADFGLIDLDSDTSLVQFNLQALFSHLERNRIQKRTRAAHLAMAGKGLLPFGIQTYGYGHQEGKAFIIPDRAAVVRRIFEMSAAGESFLSIQNALNHESVPAPGKHRLGTDNLWHRTVISRMIRNTAYKGEYYWGHPKRFLIPIPAIVSEELWTKAQKRKRGRAPSSGFALVGHLRCGVCGRRMQAKSDKRPRKEWQGYRCCSDSLPTGHCGMKYLPRHPLEEKAEQTLRETLSNPAEIRAMLSAAAPTDTRHAEELSAIRAEDARWLEAFKLGVITPQELGAYREELRQRAAALETTQEPELPVEAFVQAAKEMPFVELLKEGGFVFIAAPDGSVRVTLE